MISIIRPVSCADTRSVLLLAAAGCASSALAQCPPTFSVGASWAMGSPHSLAVGDFDNDGRLDFAAGNFNQHNVRVRFATAGQPLGTSYTSDLAIATELNPTWIASGDFNNDGIDDLAVVCTSTGQVRVLISNGNRTFRDAAIYSGSSAPFYIRAADITGDGVTDLVGLTTGAVSVIAGGNGPGGAWAGGGNEAFSARPVVTTGISTCAFTDLNADGALDVALASSSNGQMKVGLAIAPGSTAFAPLVTYTTGAFGTFMPNSGDFNGDGRDDIVVSHTVTNTVQVLLSNPNGTLTAQASVSAGGQSPRSADVADFNGDGRLDVVVAGTNSGLISVHLGNGSGGLGAANTIAIAAPTTTRVADMNNDGRPDIIVSSQTGGVARVLLNTTPATSFTTQPLDRRICPGGGSGAVFNAAAVTNQVGGITGYRWERRVGSAWEQLVDGPLAGVGTIATSSTNTLQVGGVPGNPGATVMTVRAVATTVCGPHVSLPATLSLIAPCGGADVGATGGVFTGCGDGVLDNNDFVVFIDLFFNGDVIADVGSQGGVPGADGQFNNNDFVVFIDMFFSGCTI